MKSKLKLFATLFALIVCLTGCLQPSSEKDCTYCENFCDSCNSLSGYYFYHRYYFEGDESCLDSALMIINCALPKCEENKFDMSIRKLAVLCGKQEYEQAIWFMDSIDFSEQEYSLYEKIIRNRILAMKYHNRLVEYDDAESLEERNFCLEEIINILDGYLSEHSASVDSVWMNIDDKYYDSIVMATSQYYYYLSVLKGSDYAIGKVDSLYSCGKINQAGLYRLRNTCYSHVKFFDIFGHIKLSS